MNKESSTKAYMLVNNFWESVVRCGGNYAALCAEYPDHRDLFKRLNDIDFTNTETISIYDLELAKLLAEKFIAKKKAEKAGRAFKEDFLRNINKHIVSVDGETLRLEYGDHAITFKVKDEDFVVTSITHKWREDYGRADKEIRTSS